eukprot:362556-Chlamydomonas_euryale.AAC.6
MCQEIVESLDHTHSNHRSYLEPREGPALRARVSGNSGSACHYPFPATAAVPATTRAPGLVAPSRTAESFLLVTGKYLAELEARRAEGPWQPHRTAGGPSGSSGEPLEYTLCIQDDINEQRSRYQAGAQPAPEVAGNVTQ